MGRGARVQEHNPGPLSCGGSARPFLAQNQMIIPEVPGEVVLQDYSHMRTIVTGDDMDNPNSQPPLHVGVSVRLGSPSAQ